jgi:hypothetical protein
MLITSEMLGSASVPIYSPDDETYRQRVHANGRPRDQAFDPSDALFRRYPEKFLVDGKPVPVVMQAMKFDENSGISVNWGRYSEPQDVLEPDCCDGSRRQDCVVLTIMVSEVPSQVLTTDGSNRVFRFPLKHGPKAHCYAHSEIWCNQSGDVDQPHESPPKQVKDEFRLRLFEPMGARVPLSLKPRA